VNDEELTVPKWLEEVDRQAMEGVLPSAFTVQSMVAHIRIMSKTIESQRRAINALREAKGIPHG